MHFLLIYAKPLKNNFERVLFTVKFQLMGGSGEIMVGCGRWWQNYSFSWVVVDDRGWSHDLVMPEKNV